MRRRKKGSISYYQKKLDDVFGAYIRSTGSCAHCGRTDTLACAHIVGRRNMTLRWDEQNALPLCYKCHIHWNHKEPLDFTAWFTEKYPNRVRYLEMNRNNLVKRTVEDYQNLITYYQEKLNGA